MASDDIFRVTPEFQVWKERQHWVDQTARYVLDIYVDRSHYGLNLTREQVKELRRVLKDVLDGE